MTSLRGAIDLPATLQGGQAFRWRREGDDFLGVIGGSAVRLRADGDGARASATPRLPRAVLERYLGLGPEADAARDRLARDPVLARAVADAPGLRVLRQDPWETTVAFITSANNNVLRIEGILARIAEQYGEPIPETSARAFPTAERLARARESSLRALGLGYRAPFVRASARMVARGEVDLAALRGAPAAESREALLALPGVGPKVADCIALFSLDATDAFPVDRWILRAVSDALFGGAAVKPQEAVAFARARWGADAGLAQQYLFHAVRAAGRAPGTARLSASP